MSLVSEPVEKDPALEISRYDTRFIFKEQPKTPLGDNWKFVPCTLPKRFETYANDFKNFNVLSDDIWLITYPKSGTTWSQEIISLIINDLNYEKCRSINLYQRFPFFELSAFKMSSDINEDYTQIIENYSSMEKPRCFKTHLPTMLLPSMLWTVKPKIIYVARDPRDAAVSYFHHNKHFDGFNNTMDEFLLKFLKGTCGYGPYPNHIAEFWHMRNEKNILFITYEEMLADFPVVLKKIANFLNKSITTDEINKLANYLSFNAMKNSKYFNYNEDLRDVMPDKTQHIDFDFLRKGKIGTYKEEMSSELIEKFNFWLKEQFPLYKQIFNKDI